MGNSSRQILFELLPEVTSISVISDFLKQKGLPFSAGSWGQMIEGRLVPYLNEGKIRESEVVALLAEAEEHSGVHGFLYSIEPNVAGALIEMSRITNIAASCGLAECLGQGRVLDKPSQPTLSSIRLESDDTGQRLIIKIIEQRLEHVYLGQTEHGDRITKEWQVNRSRAVNILRLFAHGLLELRISRRSSTTKYDGDIANIAKLVEPFVPIKGFSEFSLRTAKNRLWNERSQLATKIRYHTSTIKNTNGSSIIASSRSSETNMVNDKAVTASVDAFLTSGVSAHCESSNLYWLRREGDLPSKEVHMLLPERRNEFAIPAACSKLDFDHVFNQLRLYSTAVPG